MHNLDYNFVILIYPAMRLLSSFRWYRDATTRKVKRQRNLLHAQR
jgi:hypothetical protein